MSAVDHWIRTSVCGKDFADVGGLWGLVNEKIVCASQAGARSVTMIDIAESDNDLWKQFKARCAAEGIVDYRCVSLDIHTAIAQLTQRFEVVHCSGLLYHCPHPLDTLRSLQRICTETLFIGSVVIPPRLGQPGESIACDSGAALFVPTLSDQERQTMTTYFQQVGATMIVGLDRPAYWSDRYEPWWWLFTAEYLQTLIGIAGFTVSDTCELWEGRAMYFRAERIR